MTCFYKTGDLVYFIPAYPKSKRLYNNFLHSVPGIIDKINTLDFMDILFYNVYIHDLGNIYVYNEEELIPREMYHSRVWKELISLEDSAIAISDY